jgi:hypothetical protein
VLWPTSFGGKSAVDAKGPCNRILAARQLGGRTLDVSRGVERRVTLMALDQGWYFLRGPPIDDQSFTSKIKDK